MSKNKTEHPEVTSDSTTELKKNHQPIQDCFEISPSLTAKVMIATLPNETTDKDYNATKELVNAAIKKHSYDKNSACPKVVDAMENLRKLNTNPNNRVNTENVIKNITNKQNKDQSWTTKSTQGKSQNGCSIM